MGVLVGAILIAGLCVVPLRMLNAGDVPEGVAADSATASPVQDRPALTAADYQVLLTKVDKELTAGFSKLTGAKTPDAVSKAADDLAESIRDRMEELSAVGAPQPATSAHEGLLSALGELSTEVLDAGLAADGQEICGGSSAASVVSRSDPAKTLRSVAGTLSTADPAQAYRIGAFLPKESKERSRRLKNGTYVRRLRGGLGRLEINNAGSTDTVISMVDKGEKKPDVMVFLRAGAKHTVTSIRDGAYTLYLTGGKDWDGKRFTRSCTFSKFDEPIEFKTTDRRFTVWEISLDKSDSGNASTSDIDAGAFPGS